MRTYLDDLSPDEIRVLARIRLAVTARLVAMATPLAPELVGLSAAPFRLALSSPGLPAARIGCGGNGEARASAGEEAPVFHGLADMTVRFPSARDCARVLGGAKGSIQPLPGGAHPARALRFFRAAAAAAPRMLKAPETPAATRARLLLEVALSALVETGNADAYVALKMRHTPDGLVLVDAGEGIRRALRKGGGVLSFEPLPPRDVRPDVVLAFRDPQSAVSVLSGQQPAVVALGSGGAAVHGLLPLIQGLFSILDRASQYLSVKAEKESDHAR